MVGSAIINRVPGILQMLLHSLPGEIRLLVVKHIIDAPHARVGINTQVYKTSSFIL